MDDGVKLREGYWHNGLFLGNQGKCLTKLKPYADAQTALLEAYGILETALGPEHKRTIKVIRFLIDLYDAWHEAEPDPGYDAQAAQWRATSLETSMPHLDRITVDPDIMGGRPCIRGMRMPVSRILGMLAAGEDEATILRNHPDFETDDLRQALSYAVMVTDNQIATLTGA